jgi:hypothetical protein
MMNSLRACALLFALVFTVPTAFADSATTTMDLEPPATAQVWLNVGGFSRHFDRNRGFNEHNLGLGLEYRTSPELSYMAGIYYNSVRKNTTYAAVNWQPWSVGPFKVGAAIGFMNGYPAVNSGGTFFAALPMVSYEGRRFGVNFGLIPSTKNVEGAVTLQFKARIN